MDLKKKKNGKKKILPDGHQCSLKARLMWPFTHGAKALLCQTLKTQCPLSCNESSTMTEDCQLKRRHWDTNVIKAPLVDRHPYHRCQRQKLYLLELSVTAWRINPFCQRAAWPNCDSFFFFFHCDDSCVHEQSRRAQTGLLCVMYRLEMIV